MSSLEWQTFLSYIDIPGHSYSVPFSVLVWNFFKIPWKFFLKITPKADITNILFIILQNYVIFVNGLKCKTHCFWISYKIFDFYWNVFYHFQPIRYSLYKERYVLYKMTFMTEAVFVKNRFPQKNKTFYPLPMIKKSRQIFIDPRILSSVHEKPPAFLWFSRSYPNHFIIWY